jgi:PAS domain S-box-containing protein
MKQNDLLGLSFELTVYGLMLTLILSFSRGQMDATNVAAVCVFMASAFVFKLLYPVNAFNRYYWSRIGAIAVCALFGWWLVYQAENTRASWYRFNVLQKRVESFIAQAPGYVVLSDADGVIRKTSNNIKLLTGYTPEELQGKPVTILMRSGPAARHQVAFTKAVAALKRNDTKDVGWLLQGVFTVGIKRKDGTITPVKAYAGGIRWSTDIQFSGDIDMFAIFTPASIEEARNTNSNIGDNVPLKTSPDAPKVSPAIKP